MSAQPSWWRAAAVIAALAYLAVFLWIASGGPDANGAARVPDGPLPAMDCGSFGCVPLVNGGGR